MAVSRYDLMKKSEVVKDEDGNFYFDPLTLRLSSFRLKRPAVEYYLTEIDISRIDLLMFRVYNTPYFDDILNLLNNVGLMDDLDPGYKYYLPERDDLETFILNNTPSG